MSDGVLAVVIASVLSLIGTVVLFAGTRGKTRADAKASLDKRIDDRVSGELTRVYERLDEVENALTKQTGAFTRILRTIARQWTGDPTGPDLDPGDIAEIEDTIPPQWIRRNPNL